MERGVKGRERVEGTQEREGGETWNRKEKGEIQRVRNGDREGNRGEETRGDWRQWDKRSLGNKGRDGERV